MIHLPTFCQHKTKGSVEIWRLSKMCYGTDTGHLGLDHWTRPFCLVPFKDETMKSQNIIGNQHSNIYLTCIKLLVISKVIVVFVCLLAYFYQIQLRSKTLYLIQVNKNNILWVRCFDGKDQIKYVYSQQENVSYY